MSAVIPNIEQLVTDYINFLITVSRNYQTWQQLFRCPKCKQPKLDFNLDTQNNPHPIICFNCKSTFYIGEATN